MFNEIMMEAKYIEKLLAGAKVEWKMLRKFNFTTIDINN